MFDSKDPFKNLGINNSFSSNPMREIRESLLAIQSHKSVLESLGMLNEMKVADPFAETRKSILAFQSNKSVLETFKSLNEIRMANPFAEIRESLMSLQSNNSVLEAFKSLNDLKVVNPLKGAQESLQSLQSNKSMSEAFRALNSMGASNPFREARESLLALQSHKSVLETFKALEAMNTVDPLRSMRESLLLAQKGDSLSDIFASFKDAKTHDPVNSVIHSIKVLSDERLRLDVEDVSSIKVNPDGQIFLGSNSISQRDLQEMSNRIINDSFSKTSGRVEEKIDKLLEAISSLNDPFLYKLLVSLIFPILIGLIFSVVNSVADFYVKEALTSNQKKSVVKEIQVAASKSEIKKTYLSAFRVVSADRLNVRGDPSNKSTAIGTLYFGSVVEVLEKGRDWSLISWHDGEGNAAIQGWVYSRYLKKLN